VLRRIYGPLDPNAPYAPWMVKAHGERTYDAKEVGPLALLTAEVETWRVRLVDERTLARMTSFAHKPAQGADAVAKKTLAAVRASQKESALVAEDAARSAMDRATAGHQAAAARDELRSARASQQRRARDAATTERLLVTPDELRARERALLDSTTTPEEGLAYALRSSSPKPRRPGESGPAAKARKLEERAAYRAFLAEVARQTDQLLVRACSSYRRVRGEGGK